MCSRLILLACAIGCVSIEARSYSAPPPPINGVFTPADEWVEDLQIPDQSLVAVSCGDDNENCQSWADGGECTRNPGYMDGACKKACGKCGGATPTKQPTQPSHAADGCTDKNLPGGAAWVDITGDSCAKYVTNNWCNKYGDMYDRGELTANLACCGCGGGSSGGGGSTTTAVTPTEEPTQATQACTDPDTNENCKTWGDAGECGKNPGYMNSACAKTCGCGLPTAAPTVAPMLPEAERKCNSLLPVKVPMATAVNIVMVPSGFNGDMVKFKEKALWILANFKNHPPLDAANIPSLNIYAVEAESDGDDGSQCYQPCAGVERLMCCEREFMFNHVQKHCGSGFYQNLLVIRNSDLYGASGGTNMATVGYHESAPAVAVHEIGHSMFGLADEYAGGDGKPSAPNCVKKCSELTRGSNSLRKFDGFKCTKACQGTGFYAGGVTMMQFSESQFGAVNERITCCKYLFHGHTPPYCEQYDKSPLNLRKYCVASVWQGKEPVNLALVEEGSTEHMQARAEDRVGVQYSHVADPVQWEAVKDTTGNWNCAATGNALTSGLFEKELVQGEAHDGETNLGEWTTDAMSDDGDIVISVTTTADPITVKRELKFHPKINVEVPPGPDGYFKDPPKKLERTRFEMVLKEGEICQIGTSA